MRYYIGDTKPQKDDKYLLRFKKRKDARITVSDTFEWLLVKNGRCLFESDGVRTYFDGVRDISEGFDEQLTKLSKNRYIFGKTKIKLTAWDMTCMDFESVLYMLEAGNSVYYIMETDSAENGIAFHYCMEEIPSFGAGVARSAAACGDSLLSYTTRAECPSKGNPVLRDSMGSVHGHLIRLIRLNTDGVLKGYDTEFLHDLRVSVRRLRSALSLVKNVYTKGIEDNFRIRFRALGELTGRARDMDVYLEEIDGYADILPAEMKESLNGIRDYFEKIRDGEYRKLRKYIRSQEFTEMLREWERVTGGYSETGRRGFLTTKRASKAILKKAYDNAVLLSEELDGQTADAQIHEIRIAFKKLRYCIEFFCRYLGEENTADVLTELRNLQDSLGRFNDLSVQCVNMTEILGREKDAQASAACGYILAYLAQAKEAERARAAGLIKDFCKRKKRVKNALGI